MIALGRTRLLLQKMSNMLSGAFILESGGTCIYVIIVLLTESTWPACSDVVKRLKIFILRTSRSMAVKFGM